MSKCVRAIMPSVTSLNGFAINVKTMCGACRQSNIPLS